MFDGRSPSSVSSAVFGVNFFCKFLGETEVGESFEVKSVVSYAGRFIPVRRKCKSVVSPEAIRQVIEAISKPTASLLQMRSAVLSVLGYAGFFRISDLRRLRREHVQVAEHCVVVDVVKSKTDQMGLGDRVYVGATGGPTCPVRLISRYFTMCQFKDYEYLFCNVDHKSNSRLSSVNKPISYSNARDCFRRIMCTTSSEVSNFTLHGLRHGDATAAARAGVPERVIKRQGRWKSDRCKNLYIATDSDEQATISSAIGL